jgi:hypothetical protein
MPEQDFELYLSLLSRFLRLKSAQRGEIADELRDHLEARLEELAARGLSRDEAIKAALDEFGDAAELANHFTQVAHIRKRRLIMRVTFGTITALAASLLVATAFWPEARQASVPQRAMAQFAGEPKKPTEPTVVTVDDGKTAAEAKLSKVLATIPDELSNTDLTQAIQMLGELLDIDILVDHAAIGEAEIATDKTVTLNVKRTKLTGRMALDLVLEPLKLSYTIRDGLIMVTTAEQANQIQVYNVRDLLPNLAEPVGGAGAGSGMAAPGTMGMSGGAPSMPGGRGMMRSMMGVRMGMGGAAAGDDAGGLGGGMGGLPAIRETDSLAELIATTIDPVSWDCGGGNGSIIQYHELLVVKNSQTVHGKIKALLEMMRTTASRPRGAAAPGGSAPHAR